MVFSIVNAWFLGYFVAAILVDENQRSVTMSLAHFVYLYMSLLCLRPFVVIFLLLDQFLRRALVRIIVVHHIFPLSKELVSILKGVILLPLRYLCSCLNAVNPNHRTWIISQVLVIIIIIINPRSPAGGA